MTMIKIWGRADKRLCLFYEFVLRAISCEEILHDDGKNIGQNWQKIVSLFWQFMQRAMCCV